MEFQDYIAMISQKLECQAEFIPELGCYLFTSKRMGAALTSMHNFIFVKLDEEADAVSVENYSAACAKYALENYKGVVRGMQKGVVMYPVICQTHASETLMAQVQKKPSSHWAAFELAVAVDLSERRISYMKSTPLWGAAMWKGIKKAADKALGF